MRNIPITTDVFAAIWQARKEGEESEDAILRRILGLPAQTAPEVTGGRRGGFYDERSGVHFPEGREIYRTYKGHKVEAVAHLDRWFVRATGQSFHSLHKLSQAINNGKQENAWLNWKYRDPDTGEEHLIDHLRKTQGASES
ncbi:hypothetical protein CIT37_10730 [Bradyrhizobium ottawaense]|uniref:DUF2924 domain-containing protein n=1 Tax=Bradyrhizobium ottawaense TaxID=931866 RepID=A0A2U8P4I3_9BRAD|nr:hypothetical protein [Bradyrhizobium ottawaense]AWL92633.1 hypothetical protein CIT37_10730 [Bradyrhizobium ottawaense]